MAKKAPTTELIGSFSEDEARALSDALHRREGIRATVSQLHGNKEPTCWWIVEVAPRDAKLATTFYRGFREGRLHYQIERFRECAAGRGLSYAQAAHKFGYPEIMPSMPTSTEAK